MLYSDEFVQGLKALRIENFDKNVLVIFMESLQSEEEEDELWIDLPYMENLIDHYLAESSDEEDEEDYEDEDEDYGAYSENLEY